MKVFWDLLMAGTLAVCLATVVGLLGRTWWVFDLASHFRAQYFVILGASAMVFLFDQRYPASIVAAIFSLINLGYLLPFYRGRAISRNPAKGTNGNSRGKRRMPSGVADSIGHPSPDTANPMEVERSYRVLLSNVLRINQSYDLLRELVRTTSPDLIALVEISREWMQALEPIRDDYAHQKCAVRSDDYGLALLSRIPFREAEIHSFGGSDRPSIVACMEAAGRDLTLVLTHPPPPKSKAEAEARNQQFVEIAEYAASHDSSLMLMGDLNISPWSVHFKDLLREGRFRDSRVGFGLQPSWPASIPFLRIPIDHILVSSGFKVYERKLGPKIGSDHLPVILDFALFDY